MGNLGPGELLIILLIAVVLFGAGKFADIGKGLGQGIRNFKKGLRDTEEDDRVAKKKDDVADKKDDKSDKDEKASASA
ncbi:MAG TPA: twin-arginine translocase TatA/TatE family subunit [Polyangiaceae bacterium]